MNSKLVKRLRKMARKHMESIGYPWSKGVFRRYKKEYLLLRRSNRDPLTSYR